MGTANVTDTVDQERNEAVKVLTEAAEALRALKARAKDEAWLVEIMAVSDVVVEYDRKVTLKILALHDGGERSTVILGKIGECRQLLAAEQGEIEKLLEVRKQARLRATIETLAPGLLDLVAAYRAKAGVHAVADLDLEVLAARLADLPNAAAQWQRIDEAALERVKNFPLGDQRDAARTAWYMVRDTVAAKSQAIQDERNSARKAAKKAFEAELAKVKVLLQHPGWTDDAKDQLNRAVSMFEDGISRGWQITEEQLTRFYRKAGQSDPMDSIAGYAIPATDQDLSAKLFVLPLNAGHTGRIRSYITDRVVPAARKAGLAMTGDAVITLVKDVAVAWCSLAEDSDTGGNPARVKNFSRGDLISTIRDLPDESKTRQLTVEERIAVVERAISFENRPSVRFKLLEQLKTLQQQLGESKGK